MRTARARISGEYRFDVLLFPIALILSQVEGLQQTRSGSEAWPIIPRYEHHGVRRRVHGRYLIFYRIAEGRIVILHVLNGAMDVEAILFPNG